MKVGWFTYVSTLLWLCTFAYLFYIHHHLQNAINIHPAKTNSFPASLFTAATTSSSSSSSSSPQTHYFPEPAVSFRGGLRDGKASLIRPKSDKFDVNNNNNNINYNYNYNNNNGENNYLPSNPYLNANANANPGSDHLSLVHEESEHLISTADLKRLEYERIIGYNKAIASSSSSSGSGESGSQQSNILVPDHDPIDNNMIRSQVSLNSNSNSNNPMGDVIRSFHPIRQEFYDLVGRYIKYHNDATGNEKMISNSTTPEDVKSVLIEKRKMFKWMIVKPGGQLCNRMRGVITAFLLALLTNRVLVVEGLTYGETKSFYELFKSPGFDIEFRLPAGINRDGAPLKLDMDQKDLGEIVETWLCRDLEARNRHVNVMTLHGTNYIGNFLYKNPYFMKKLGEWFVEDDIFRPLLFWLFRPTEFVLELKDGYKRWIKQNLYNNRMKLLQQQQQQQQQENVNNAISATEESKSTDSIDIDATPSNSFVTGYHIRSEYPITEIEWRAYAACEAENVPIPFRNSFGNYRVVATDSPKSRENVRLYLGNDTFFYSHNDMENQLRDFEARKMQEDTGSSLDKVKVSNSARRLSEFYEFLNDDVDRKSNSNRKSDFSIMNARHRRRLLSPLTKEGIVSTNSKTEDEKFHKGKSIFGMYAVLVDILLVSESDQIFLTPFSSFSRIIGLYAKTPNVYMVSDYGVPEQDTHRKFTKIQPHCYRYIRKEECVWMGWRRNYSELVQAASCYSPYMLSDYC